MRVRQLLIPGVLLAVPAGVVAQVGYVPAPAPTRVLEGPQGLVIKVLLEAAALGGSEVELAEITFPAGLSPTRAHRHGAVEILYILEGELDHVVNGVAHRLTAGGVGIVRPGDDVIHRVVSTGPVRALVVWTPGGEVARIAPAFRERAPGG